MKTVVFALIDFARNVRLVPGGSACRFQPTCSGYAKEAVGKYGVIKGLWLAARRLARCHPFAKGGWDPVS